MGLSRSDDESSVDDRDTEALTLHRLDTAPRPQQQHRRRKSETVYSDDADDEDDEQAFLRDADLEAAISARRHAAAQRAAESAAADDKTGRPDWLKDGIQIARTSRRARIFLITGLILLLVAIFSFAFGDPSNDDSHLHGMYTWAGDIWRGTGDGGAGGQVFNFPTDVGYPGPTQTGKPAFLEQEDTFKAAPTRGSSSIQTGVAELPDFDLFKHMGNLSPYFSSPGFGIDNAKYRVLPETCHVDRVHILHRHGSRYATTSSPANGLGKLLREKKQAATFTGPLSFLSRFDPDRLGLELLVPLGRQQLFESGVQHDMEYGQLIEKDLKAHQRILVRAGSQQRIVDSAIAFLQGLFANKWSAKTDLEIQIEAPSFNTTLAPNFACTRAGRPETEPGIEWGKAWIQTYLAAAVQRLAPHAQGITIDAQLLNGMQQLCSYETVAFGRSDFCGLFTKQEWLDYEYFWDLVFYGSYGDGSEVGRAQGVGWVNEFMARLTKTQWDPLTQTSENRTFNTNPTTFPLDRSFYADFTHDSTIAGVIAALNLADFNAPLSKNTVDPARKYRASHLVPYAARLVFEEITCDGNAGLVRLLINEAIVDLRQLKGCAQREDGMCQRQQFIDALAPRNQWAHWERCFDKG